jgi:hypothetical protein
MSTGNQPCRQESFWIHARSPMHTSSRAGREIFVSHNSGRVTAQPTVSVASENVRFWEQAKCPVSSKSKSSCSRRSGGGNRAWLQLSREHLRLFRSSHRQSGRNLSGLATIHSQLVADATALLAGNDDLLDLSCFTCRCGHVDTGLIGPRPDEPKPKRNARQRSPHQVGSTTVDGNIEPLV